MSAAGRLFVPAGRPPESPKKKRMQRKPEPIMSEPAHHNARQAEAAPREAERESVRDDNPHILVADDEPAIRELFCMMLCEAFPEYVVDSAANGEEAVRAFCRSRPRVVVLDLHMPVMDGQAAFLKIRRLCEERNWRMPSVVFCTGFAPPAMIRRVVTGSTLHGFLSKPVAEATLVRHVRERLARTGEGGP
jgi:CheY-like chemotaxis protein